MARNTPIQGSAADIIKVAMLDIHRRLLRDLPGQLMIMQVHDELVEIMSKDSSTVGKAIPLLLVSRHLERISDHATNICEDIVYMVEGKVVKHSGRPNN